MIKPKKNLHHLFDQKTRPKFFVLNKINCPKNNIFNLRTNQNLQQNKMQIWSKKITHKTITNKHTKNPKILPIPSLSLSLSLSFAYAIFASHSSSLLVSGHYSKKLNLFRWWLHFSFDLVYHLLLTLMAEVSLFDMWVFDFKYYKPRGSVGGTCGLWTCGC